MQIMAFKAGPVAIFVAGILCGFVLADFWLGREAAATRYRESMLTEQVHSWMDLAAEREKEIWELQSQLEGDK